MVGQRISAQLSCQPAFWQPASVSRHLSAGICQPASVSQHLSAGICQPASISRHSDSRHLSAGIYQPAFWQLASVSQHLSAGIASLLSTTSIPISPQPPSSKWRNNKYIQVLRTCLHTPLKEDWIENITRQPVSYVKYKRNVTKEKKNEWMDRRTDPHTKMLKRIWNGAGRWIQEQ